MLDFVIQFLEVVLSVISVIYFQILHYTLS